MEGFDLIALYNIDETVMRGGDLIVVSQSEYYRKLELFERWEAGAVIAHMVWRSGINDPLQSCGGGSSGGESCGGETSSGKSRGG